MDWIMAAIETTTEGIEPICGRLYTLGVTGTEIEDAADFNDFLENDTKYWDYIDESLLYKKTAPTCVKVYLTDDEHGRAQLSAIRQSMAELAALDGEGRFGTLTVSLTNMQEQDWAENWKKYYKPLKVGEKILIKPEWEDLADDEGRTVFHINPGMSFGTGTHESTQLCLESLEKHINKGDSVLDLGCGSGILSIVARTRSKLLKKTPLKTGLQRIAIQRLQRTFSPTRRRVAVSLHSSTTSYSPILLRT